jgi:anti-sigma28 factor (negative regulator of flagellin synthesis)
MATKKTSSKKSYSKKASSKKSSATKTQTVKLAGNKFKLDLALDASKVAAIKRCIDNGQLSITISRVDLDAGLLRLSGPYAYD